MNTDILFGTVGQAVAWLVSVGIVAFVSYGMAWTNWDDVTKKRVGYVLTAVLTALVTLLALLGASSGDRTFVRWILLQVEAVR